jgi:predicted nucleic acid-binding Zn ribbon protein
MIISHAKIPYDLKKSNYKQMKYESNSGRKKEAAPLEAAFNELLKAYRLEDKFKEKQLISSWGEIVGRTISDRTTSVFIKEKKLFVKLTSGPVKKELMLNRSKVLILIEEKVGKGVVEDLICL